jgi:heme exporter protein A
MMHQKGLLMRPTKHFCCEPKLSKCEIDISVFRQWAGATNQGRMCVADEGLLTRMLNVESITYYRDQEPVLESVSLTLDAGVVMMVRGGNGSGKTTLLKLLAGLLPPQEDFKVSQRGEKFDPREPHTQSRLAYLGHTLGIKDDLTCQENLEFLARFMGQREGQTPQTALESVGLDGFQYSFARRLSAGQRKRLALARLVLCPAQLWMLDEPYSNLDKGGIALVDRLLQNHIDGGGSAIITSHGTFQPQVTKHDEMLLESAA